MCFVFFFYQVIHRIYVPKHLNCGAFQIQKELFYDSNYGPKNTAESFELTKETSSSRETGCCIKIDCEDYNISESRKSASSIIQFFFMNSFRCLQHISVCSDVMSSFFWLSAGPIVKFEKSFANDPGREAFKFYHYSASELGGGSDGAGRKSPTGRSAHEYHH